MSHADGVDSVFRRMVEFGTSALMGGGAGFKMSQWKYQSQQETIEVLQANVEALNGMADICERDRVKTHLELCDIRAEMARLKSQGQVQA